MGYKDILNLKDLAGMKDKLKFLRDHSDDEWFTKFLYYALNPLITYNLSEKTLDDITQKEPAEELKMCSFFDDIFDCCDYLSRLRGMDDATLRQVQAFLYRCENPEKELYKKLLSKTIRLGVTAKTVNKVINGLIPNWEVQQAYPIDKFPPNDGTEFWLTQKLNGVRATFYNGQLIARSGSSYSGVDHIVSSIRWATDSGVVLDGELTLLNKGKLSDNEAFRIATGVLNSDNEDKTEICYTIFDAIPVKDFESIRPAMNYSSRREIMSDISSKLLGSKYVKVLPVLYHGNDLSKVDELLEKMVSEDKEGLVMNLDVPYRRTRHKGILKIKRFYTMDLPIIRVEEGSGRLSGTLGALVVKYKDNEVKVGTGIPDSERDRMWREKESILGELCEVKYKEVSMDKSTGKESLQFPVFVQIRDDKSEESYG